VINLIKNVEKVALKKVDGSWKFRSIFDFIGSILTLLGFIEKQAPQKALCLGPDPPPEKKWNFIDFLRFLLILGPSIEPEKPSPKSASTANPPQKVKFMANLLKFYRKWVFNLSRPNLVLTFYFYVYRFCPLLIFVCLLAL
jgi:hypothetical protein